MQFHIDHLAAIVVGTVVLMILVGVSLSAQTGAIEATQADARFDTADAIAEGLTADLPNVGAGVPDGQPRILALDGTAEITTAFEFSGAVGRAADAPVQRVRYELRQAGTVTLGGGDAKRTVPAYELRRLLHDGSAFVVASRSRPTVTGFSVRLLDATGAPVGTDLDQARVAEVAIAAATPLGDGTTVSRWQRRFQLTNVSL